MRRIVFAAAAGVALGGCATTPAAPAPAVPTLVGQAPASSAEGDRLARLLASAGQADAPTRNAIERSFGQADIVRQEGAGLALTYRLDSCALLLLFAADGRNDMRLAQAHPSARRADAVAPSLSQCGAEAAARRR